MAKYCPLKQNYALYLDCRECHERICDAFFCLVVGSRAFGDYDLLSLKLDIFLEKQQDAVIVSGGAAGADSLAARYARENGLPLITFPADWKKYGKMAGYKRNRQMHEFIAKFEKRGCVAFWDGTSKGTAQNFALALEFQTPLRVTRYLKPQA